MISIGHEMMKEEKNINEYTDRSAWLRTVCEIYYQYNDAVYNWYVVK